MFVTLFLCLAIPNAALNLGHLHIPRRSSCFPSEHTRHTYRNLSGYVQRDDKYFWIMTRTGGLNNQLTTLYEGIARGLALNRTLVVPYFDSFDHMGTGLFPFADFFDMGSMLKLGLKVVTPIEAAKICQREVWIPEKKPYPPPSPRAIDLYETRLRLTFRKTDESVLSNKPCIAQTHGSTGFPRYSDYANAGQGWSLGQGIDNAFAQVWYMLYPNWALQAHVEQILQQLPLRFNALVARRGDYGKFCRKALRKWAKPYGNEACYQSADHIRSKIASFTKKESPVFVQTNDPKWMMQVLGGKVHENRSSDLQEFVGGFNNASYFYLLPDQFPTHKDLDVVIESMIAANADEVILNRFSSTSSATSNMHLECKPQSAQEYFGTFAWVIERR